MQSVVTDLAILENIYDSVYKCNDWVRSGVDGIEIDVSQSQTSPNEDEADVDGVNDIENERKKSKGITFESLPYEVLWKKESRNQAIGKDGGKLASFLGIVSRTPELTLLHINDWRILDKDEKKKLDMINEKLSNNDGSDEQPSPFVACRSSFENIGEEDSSNEVVKKLEQEVLSDWHERVQQSPQMLFKGHSVAGNTLSSHFIVYELAVFEWTWNGNANMEIPGRKSGFDFHANEG
ncbi:hypothetical protein HAX54_016235 [Datura stramonium]|uniref:Uncharacterized protein n=1 Tax=Datura stramonium TaxID=4076 RepID=A0ABS8ULG3_DATST|nr:hypothetical protein [Datura stramonium]